jgi:hypothetical protein
MSTIAIVIGTQIDQVISGKRKYITNPVARHIAHTWKSGQKGELYRLAMCGGITDATLLRAEISRIADDISAVPGFSEYAYSQLLALDTYVSRCSKSRKPVKGWESLTVA